MYQNVQVSKNTALKQLISCYLMAAMDTYLAQEDSQDITTVKIPLHQGRDINRVVYISGVALRLAKSHNFVAEELASAIASQISATCGGKLLLKIVSPSWIHIEVTNAVLADWLHSIAFGESESSLNFIGLNPSLHSQCARAKTHNPLRLFSIQYAHARCYSLILLAHRERLIKFKEALQTSSQSWHLGSLVAAEAFPWLNSSRQLRLNHPAESSLMMELVKVVDELECSDDTDKVNWEKLGWDLSNAFEDFWRQCRIWGEVKTNSPELTQVRLGLVMATQSVFRFLLIDKLGVTAPVDL